MTYQENFFAKEVHVSDSTGGPGARGYPGAELPRWRYQGPRAADRWPHTDTEPVRDPQNQSRTEVKAGGEKCSTDVLSLGSGRSPPVRGEGSGGLAAVQKRACLRKDLLCTPRGQALRHCSSTFHRSFRVPRGRRSIIKHPSRILNQESEDSRKTGSPSTGISEGLLGKSYTPKHPWIKLAPYLPASTPCTQPREGAWLRNLPTVPKTRLQRSILGSVY